MYRVIQRAGSKVPVRHISGIGLAIFDLEFRCDVTNYNIFVFRVIQPTQPNATVSGLLAIRPCNSWVGWKLLFIVKIEFFTFSHKITFSQ